MDDSMLCFPPPVARAFLRGDETHPQLTGEVLLAPYGRGTLLLARVVGLFPAGFHGFHIHAVGSCATGGDVPFSSAGGHYDLHGVLHPWHGGDLPPLLSAANGSALLSTYTDRFHPQDVIGRSVVIHSGPDDFSTQPAGNSGGRIACGVIEAFSPGQS